MFLWRKVTIIEGNYFLLEKRVNIIKKEGREDLLAKNLERSETVMNEIFKDSVTTKPCNNLNTECKIPKNVANKYDMSDSANCDFRNDNNEYTEDIVDISINYFNIRDVVQPNNKIEIIEEPDVKILNNTDESSDIPFNLIRSDDDSEQVEHIKPLQFVNSIEKEDVIVKPVELTNSGDIFDITDSGSVCSDITFNNEDKTISKKYKNMNIEKLRDECKEKSLNTEGNKAALISRLVDSIKKQK
jgi:hypothetical protein